MHTVQPPKNNNNIVKGKLPKIGTGHASHRGGGGAHKHKSNRRIGNRSQQQTRACGEW